MSWNSDPQVPSLAGRPLQEILALRPRRQALEGFDAIYSDFVDYIVRCTYRIWDERNIGLIRTHYSSDCQVISLAGKLVGADAMLQGTMTALAGCPDRSPIAEDVIWCEDAPGVFFSSHRIMSTSSHLGPDPILGKPTRGGRAPVAVIADCVCRNNRIVQEWLVRDYAEYVRRFGLNPRLVAERLAREDLEGDQERHSWLRDELGRVLGCASQEPPRDHPAHLPARALRLAFEEERYGSAAELAATAIELRWPSGRHLVGRGAWVGCLMQLRAPLSEHRFVLDHWAARPLPDGDVAVALRWWLLGHHRHPGVWGTPTQRHLAILAISHFRIRRSHLLEDFTVFDEVGVLRQAAGGFGTCQI
jgi:hypothetical protein